MLKLFYITNNPIIAEVADKNGVDRVWIDLESIGKAERQFGRDTVISNHKIEDIPKIKAVLHNSELLVRVQPWNELSNLEIDDVIKFGADIIMLPMWTSPKEVENFLSAVAGRKKTMLLLETKEAVECIDDVLKLPFDEIHIGLNDLHISYGMQFLFEPLANGMIDSLCAKFSINEIPYGFGGIAKLGDGMIPAEMIIQEHYRLGSTMAILSRSFCNSSAEQDIKKIELLFSENVKKIRNYEKYCMSLTKRDFESNRKIIVQRINYVVDEKRKQSNA